MNDVHSGGDSIEEVIDKQKLLVYFFKSGGWSLIKFASNCPEVMQAIPVESRLPSLVLDLDSNDFDEALPWASSGIQKKTCFIAKLVKDCLK